MNLSETIYLEDEKPEWIGSWGTAQFIIFAF